MSAAGADDQSCGFARGKGLRFDEDPVVGWAIGRQIDHRRAAGGLARDRDELGRRVDLAGIVFRAVDVIDHGEIRAIGAVGDLDADGGVGGVADGDARPRARHQFDAGEQGGQRQWNNRNQNLETHHATPLARQARHTRGLWFVERKQNSLPSS